MSILNLHFSPTILTNDSRIRKEVAFITENHLVSNVEVIGIYQDGLLQEEYKSDKILYKRIKLPFYNKNWGVISKIFKIIFFNIACVLKYTRRKPKFINIHVLNLLPMGVILKLLTGATLIYDAHELETEREGLTGITKLISKLIEKFCYPFVDKTIVVNDYIKSWYEQKYKKNNVFSLRNIPEKNPTTIKSNIVRERFNIPEDHSIFIYQGILDSVRGINEILEIFSKTNSDRHLVLMGFGNLEQIIKEFESSYANIHFIAAVPYKEIVNYTSCCNVGLILLFQKLSLSYEQSLPNKFFEYLNAGTPLMVTENLRYMSNEINSNDLGFTLPSNKEEITNFINGYKKESRFVFSESINKYIENNTWNNDVQVLRDVFK